VNITGAIFCGGKSTRMGTDKSVLEIAGTPMYQRVEIAMVDAGVSEVVALGGSDLVSLRKIDDYESGEGPLSALIGGLSSEGSLLVCPCDVPAISATGLKQILTRATDIEAMAVIAKSNRLEPLIGYYSGACLPTLISAWVAGTRALKDALKLFAFETVDLEISEVLNVNRMSDLESAKRQLGLDLP